MEIVKLKNGTEEVKSLVAVTMVSLRSLISDNPIALYELMEVCKDPDHELFGNTGEKLRERNLLEPAGTVHGSIKNIVLSAMTGKGMDLCLGSPVRE